MDGHTAEVEQFDAARSLFVDDSLPVLRAARAAGIGLIYAVQRPDSDAPARLQSEFPAVDAVAHTTKAVALLLDGMAAVVFD